MARYKQPDPNQMQFVMLDFGSLFPDDHPLSQLLELIQGLDPSEFDAAYQNDSRSGGRPALPADRVLANVIYSLLNGKDGDHLWQKRKTEIPRS